MKNSDEENTRMISGTRHGKMLYVGCSVFVLVLLLIAFPVFSSAQKAPAATGAFVGADDGNGLSKVRLAVDMPCPGHAPLITQELGKVGGIKNIQFSLPNTFEVSYDPAVVSVGSILDIDIFNAYRARLIDG